MSIVWSGREYATRDSAKAAVWKFSNRGKWYRSRDDSNKRYPGKNKVRHAVWYAVQSGRMIPARNLPCFDCKKQAAQYDHFLGYRWEHRFAVQAVCRICSMARDKKKGRR